jgi:hypothetical protein
MSEVAWDKELFPGPFVPPLHGLLGPIQLEQLASMGFCTVDPPHIRIRVSVMMPDELADFLAKYPFLPKDMGVREYPPLGNREDTVGQQCLMARNTFVPVAIFVRPPMPGEPL